MPEQRQGVLAIGIDIEKLRPLDEFAADVNKFATYLSETPVEPGANKVMMPGEGSVKRMAERKTNGIPLHPFIWDKLQKLANDLNIEPPVAKK